MVHLLELSYFPSVAWFTLLWHTDTLVLEGNKNFQKRTPSNRCYLAGPNAVQRLSVPLAKGRNQQMPIRDVRIAYDEPWQRQHARSLRTAYGNSPFFEHYADELAPFFEKRFPFLFDFNLEILTFLSKKIGWKGELILCPEFIPPGKWHFGGDFRDTTGSPDEWPDWFIPARYPQVFTERNGFLPNLSILDLLCCCGKQSGEVLTKSIDLDDPLWQHLRTPSLPNSNNTPS